MGLGQEKIGGILPLDKLVQSYYNLYIVSSYTSQIKDKIMNQAYFNKDGKYVVVTALSDAGQGFITRLVISGEYTDAQAFDLCYEKEGELVSIHEINI